jgi:uracil-DNA glycosylase
MSKKTIIIEDSWKFLLKDNFEKEKLESIKSFILNEKNQGKIVYPPGALIFNAFNLTPFPKLKVIILGQDPYHGKNQAHGLSFSVPKGIKIPPSLKNIYKELQDDIDFRIPNHGNLEHWAKQGVLLLNAILTVNASEPASHKKSGWEEFTDSVIQKISDHSENKVFLLWGKFAQEKSKLIDNSKHLILKAAHPSPFSAHHGFFGCKHFSKTNDYLVKHGQNPINWQI